MLGNIGDWDYNYHSKYKMLIILLVGTTLEQYIKCIELFIVKYMLTSYVNAAG